MRLQFLLAFVFLLSATACGQSRPRRTTGPTGGVVVRAGDDLQAAFDMAAPGDTITIQAGASFTGPFTLPNKSGEQYITVRTAAFESLPKDGMRVSPGDAPLMPKILAPGNGESALKTAPGAHHFKFIGIEFKPKDTAAFSYAVIGLGSDQTKSPSETPHHFVFDHCFIHSDGASRRGIALNSGETTISNSYIAGFKEKGADSQAICGWNGPGPFHIINNYLEGAGENVLFGGADPSIANLIPSDIEIRRNYFAKPLAWRNGPWQLKNLLEFKNARRVLVEGNLFENNWKADQGGTAILLTPRNQDGNAPWTVVRDVVVRNNIVRHAANGIAILAVDYTHPSETTRSVQITNNLFYDIDSAQWGGGSGGILLDLNGPGLIGLEFLHNTAVNTGAGVLFEDGTSVVGFTLNANIMRFHIIGSGSAGNEALDRFVKGKALVRDNAIVLYEKRDYWISNYPQPNLYPESYDSIGFENAISGDYSLKANSPLKRKAIDKTDIGVDMEQLKAAGAFQAASGSQAAVTAR